MYFFSALLFNDDMKTIDEIHRANMQLLVIEYKGSGALAKQLDQSASQISQWLNGSLNSGTQKPRGMSPATCRRIERECSKATGWMDMDHDVATAKVPTLNLVPRRLLQWVSQDEAEFLSEYRACAQPEKHTAMSLVRALPKDAAIGGSGD